MITGIVAGAGLSDPISPPSVLWSVDVEAPARASTLTNYPILIHLETLPDEFWDNVASTGSDIRAEISSAQVPCHLAYIDVSQRKGWLWVLIASYSTSDVTITLYGDGVSAFPAANSTYGSEAVWAAHEAVYLFNGDLLDSTGNGHHLTERDSLAPVYDLVEWGAGGGLYGNNNRRYSCESPAFSSPATQDITIGVMGNTQRIDSGANLGLIGLYATYASGNDRTLLLQRDVDPDVMALYDLTNSYLASSGFPYTFEPHRYHMVLDAGVKRQLWKDGVKMAEQLTPSSTDWDGTKLIVGDGANTTQWIGEIGWAYVHYGVLSEEWMLAEAAMMEPGYVTSVDADAVAPYIEVHEASPAASTLTNFPYLIDLSALSPDFWNNVKSDGGDIRLYNGSDAQIPFAVLNFDHDARTGFVLARQTITTSGATFKLEVGYPLRSALAANDTYGSEATVSGYEAFYVFNGDLLDLTANSRDLTVKTGSATYRTLLGLPALDTQAAAFQASVDNTITGSAIYTMSCTVSMDRNDTNNQQAMTFCQTFGGTTNRSTIGNRETGEVYTTFSADDSWLDGPAVVRGVPVRLACTYNGSTSRRLFVNGLLEATDNTIVTKTMDTLCIGGGSASNANWRGRIAMAYLHLSVLPDAWLDYEAANYLRQNTNGVESLWIGGDA